MKKKITFIFLILLLFSLFYFYKSGRLDAVIREYLYFSNCSEPIYYKEGEIDPRFGLLTADVIKASEEASDIWNNQAGFDVFAYSEEAELTINMVYDQRQSMDTGIRSLEGDIESGKTTLDKEIESYEYQLSQFEARNNDFNRKVNEWNASKGGTQEEYDALVNEQDVLAKEAERLNFLAEKLNVSTFNYNTQINQLNQSIDTFNKTLEVKPEEGLYDPFNMHIDIYFNNEREKLVRTIAHELGHARGLGHTNDDRDIMYPITTSTLSLSDKDLELLADVCEPYPVYEPYLKNFEYNINIVKQRLVATFN